MSKVNLYEELFDNLIDDMGHWVKWQRAAVCPCVTRDSGQPDFMCPICGGSGYRYLPGKWIKVAVTSMAGQIELKSLELREPGTAYITPKSDVIMGYRDRLLFSDFSCVFSEVLHWSEEDNARGISPKTYRNIKEVISLMDKQYEYELGVDFEITEDGYHLRWLNQDYIDQLDGRNMSLLYTTTPSYLIVDLLHELRATLSDRKTKDVTFRELPKQYKAQREDFIYNVSNPQPVEKPLEEPEEPEEPEPEEPEIGEPEENTGGFEWDEEGVLVL